MRLCSTSLCLALCLLGCSSDDTSGDTDGTSSSSSSSSSSTTSADTSSSGPGACASLVVELGDVPCVRFGENELADFLEEGCDPPTCSPRTGPEDGKLPLGLSVGPDCAFMGLVGEDRIGGWAQIVDVERDGETVSVPFCAVQEETPTGYSVEFSPGPVLAASFDPADEIAVPDDPTLRVRPATDCPAGDCDFSLAFDFENAGFNASSVMLTGALEDEGGSATLVQSISANAPNVDPAFTERPWVFRLEANYCIQQGEACTLITPSTEAMDAYSAFAVIMTPQQ